MTTTAPSRRRRQIGADRRHQPIPAVPPPASSRALALGRVALVVTAVAWAGYVATIVERQLVGAEALTVRRIVETAVYVAIVTALTASAAAYLIARQGYLRRTRAHTRTARAAIETAFETAPPSVTVLVPAYREEPEVVRQTLLSAALQALPDLRVVLLLDDPPDAAPGTEEHRLLDAARAVPAEVAALLEEPYVRFATSLEQLADRPADDRMVTVEDLEHTAEDHDHAAAWLHSVADSWVRHDHTDDFFVDHVVRALAEDIAVIATALRAAASEDAEVPFGRLVQLRRRLVSTFGVEVSCFERKQYLSLSSEPSKAMNLNSYIGLLGSSYREQPTSVGTLLEPCAADDPAATLHVPRPDLLITLDADSVLLPEYGLRLAHLMTEPGNERVAVAQTPYSAFPGAPTRVERLAGATTDLQHIVHQGMAAYDAAFWVGANAVLRTEAVEELRVDDDGDGRPVARFISDRTVIEDTESTLDLTLRGWSVVNYPERLAYSASPPDFGSLCIQRQRWANGGLVILPKLVAHWRAKKRRGERRRPAELLLRLNYLASISWATAGLVLLLAYPFSTNLMSALVMAISAPYFVVMASDLKRCGYKHTDVFRIYGFNLVMLPVNASGVLRSIVQLVSGHKAAFARTPKVRHRSVAPTAFVLFPYVIMALATVALLSDIEQERWAHAVFAGTNLALALPATIAIIGLRHSALDLCLGLLRMLYARDRTVAPAPTLDPAVDWAAVLQHGSVARPQVLPVHGSVTVDLDLVVLPDVALDVRTPSTAAAAPQEELV
ncbi:MAG TPA: glycosyltransferase family 2 protein [Iamia sp.]|jgi:cellulose synthase/poly-beta-1,6-N-acetylglucosamine synthase-like glycosyltransferase|nr:glycosyltransferase family 2 protein [Iamia sp.]